MNVSAVTSFPGTMQIIFFPFHFTTFVQLTDIVFLAALVHIHALFACFDRHDIAANKKKQDTFVGWFVKQLVWIRVGNVTCNIIKILMQPETQTIQVHYQHDDVFGLDSVLRNDLIGVAGIALMTIIPGITHYR